MRTIPDHHASRRAAIYARVSTGRQAEADLSIPDQIRQGESHCAQKGWTLVDRFIEPGASATDDRRPEFQRMIDGATSPTKPYDIILVHSMSRFFRDQLQSELYVRRLRRVGVEVVSITQPFEDNPTGNLVRQILGSFDEYQSRENAKHTLRAMQENARQSFWNGSIPPFGYQVIAAAQRGAKTKKRLAICSEEAAVVRRIFELAQGSRGPTLGVKAIAAQLNADRILFRGKAFHISNVHRILTSETYAGTHHFNKREAKTGALKSRDEWVAVEVPALVTREEFDRVQASLSMRNPRKTPPRVVSGPTLLTGLARCGTCGSGMTIRTGKGGRYRYYVCAGCAQKGPTVCPGRSIGMAALDGMVLEHLAQKVFQPDRLARILEAYIERSTEADAARKERLAQARRRLTEAEGGLARLIELVERGLVDLDDPALKDRLQAARQARDAAREEIKLLDAATSSHTQSITPERIARFGAHLRSALADPDPAFRKAYLRLFVGQIEVGDNEIRMLGPTAALAKAASLDELPPASAMVPSFVREWRPLGDSNPCYRRERAAITAHGGAWP